MISFCPFSQWYANIPGKGSFACLGCCKKIKDACPMPEERLNQNRILFRSPIFYCMCKSGLCDPKYYTYATVRMCSQRGEYLVKLRFYCSVYRPHSHHDCSSTEMKFECTTVYLRWIQIHMSMDCKVPVLNSFIFDQTF